MQFDLLSKIPSKYKYYKIERISGGASKRLFYRLSKDSNSVICLDSSNEKKEYNDFIKVHSCLSKIKVSIPHIYEKNDINHILILEDFGNLRFDKILEDYPLKNLLKCAVKTLIILKNDVDINYFKDLPIYNFNTLKSEISEFLDYYYFYANKKEISKDLVEEFYECWKKVFDSINFDFNYFVHKDFNINNLMYLPSRKGQLKCGILDFQSAFLGENCWDLFSLLEDSRIYFDDQHNNYFIHYYYRNTNQKITLEEFQEKYNILNCSRQTRLLGRWVKLSKEFKESLYLSFIKITEKRLAKVIELLNRKDLKSIYAKLMPNLFQC